MPAAKLQLLGPLPLFVGVIIDFRIREDWLVLIHCVGLENQSPRRVQATCDVILYLIAKSNTFFVFFRFVFSLLQSLISITSFPLESHV